MTKPWLCESRDQQRALIGRCSKKGLHTFQSVMNIKGLYRGKTDSSVVSFTDRTFDLKRSMITRFVRHFGRKYIYI